MTVPLTCLDCGVVSKGRRCPRCERARQQQRNAQPHRAAYRDPEYRAAVRGGLCHLCGEPDADTLDHVIPLIAGGTNHYSNLRPAHRACNSSKGART